MAKTSKDSIAEGLHSPAEAYWVAQQPLLADHGYQLRPRYRPDWKPSWKGPWSSFFKNMYLCPDWIGLYSHKVIDAVRVADGTRVVIKSVTPEFDNIPLLQHLNSPEMRKDPRNNSVPLLDVIIPPKSNEDKSDHKVFLVMPMLFPLLSWHLPFLHVKEIVDVFQQIIQGIEFLHEHNIAHRDACNLNFMMDPTDVIPTGFHHAKNYCQPDGKKVIEYKDRCSVSPVRYYIIDFETADYFPNNKLCTGLYGQQKDVPEMSRTVPYDPFKLDIYQVGKLMERFTKEYSGIDFLAPVFKAMTLQDPMMRPTATEVLEQLKQVASSLKDSDMSAEIRMTNNAAYDLQLLLASVTPSRSNSRFLWINTSRCRHIISQSMSFARRKVHYLISR